MLLFFKLCPFFFKARQVACCNNKSDSDIKNDEVTFTVPQCICQFDGTVNVTSVNVTIMVIQHNDSAIV